MSLFERRLQKFSDRIYRYGPLIAALLVAALLLSNILADPDLFARLAVGRLFESLGYMPDKDPFSFSPKKEYWVDHEWLSGVVFYKIYSHFGDLGLFVFKLLMAAITAAILLAAQRFHNKKPGALILGLTLLLLFDCRYIWASTVRSQVFTYLFLALYLYIFSAYAAERRRALFLWLPVINVLWCNFHGGFVVGMGLHLLFVAAFVRRDYLFHLLILALSLAATSLTPYGPVRYWSFILMAVSMPRPSISEWSALLPWNAENIASLILISLMTLALFQKKRELYIYLLFSAALYFALSHERHLAIFYFVCIVLVIPFARLTIPRKVENAFAITAAGFACYALFQLGLFAVGARDFRLSTAGYPEGAVNWLRENAKRGNLLIDFNNGSYALWHLYPQILVSLDGRYEEVYPESTLRLVSEALSCQSPAQRGALNQLRPDYIIAGDVKPGDCFEREGFKRSFSDKHYAVYERL